MKNELIHIGGKAYKKCKIVMLPTDKAEKCIIVNDNGTFWKPLDNKAYFTQEYLKSVPAKSYHLYILSNEKIKEGDWFIMNGCIIRQCDKINNNLTASIQDKIGGQHYKDVCKKIIATTDSSLYPKCDGKCATNECVCLIPRPSNEFLKAYCDKNGKIDEVLVEYRIDQTIGKETFIGGYNQIVEDIWKARSNDEYYFTTNNGKDSWHCTYNTLKVSPDNIITIKPVIEKTYTREEVIFYINLAFEDFEGFTCEHLNKERYYKWLEENL